MLVAAALIGALTVVTAGSSSGMSLLERSKHGKMPGGKALPHFSGAMEVTFDEERQAAADAQSSAQADNPPDATASAIGCANRGSATTKFEAPAGMFAYADPFRAGVDGLAKRPLAFEATSKTTQLYHARPVPVNVTFGSLAAS